MRQRGASRNYQNHQLGLVDHEVGMGEGCWLWGDSIVSLYLREGYPLLTVETEVNGHSKCTYERGSFLVHRAVVPVQKTFTWLGCSGEHSAKK
jgi:hypothetical protein